MNPSTFRTNLKAQLDALAAYTTLKVKVHKYPPGGLALHEPTLFFADSQNIQDLFTPVGDEETTFTFTGGGYAPGAGASDAQWATAETDAHTIINGLIGQLQSDRTVNAACNWAAVQSWTITPTQTDDGTCYMDITFSLLIRVFP